MAFVNEYIPKEDWEHYGFNRSGGASGDWTIDRDADIWIRHFHTESDHTEPDGGYTGVSIWQLNWKGTLILIKLKRLEAKGKRGEHHLSKYKLLNIDIPLDIENRRDEIIQDFERAYTFRGGIGGIVSDPGFLSFTFILEK